jgi:hypothetical protein
MTWLLALVAALPLTFGTVTPGEPVSWVPPEANVAWDYQIGGVRPVPAGVGIVSRDREGEPTGLYDICYVNGFQSQPGEESFWRSGDRWQLILKDHGKPVVDEFWGEWILDIGTAAKRERLATIVGRWTQGCADSAYDAVEYDNLDTWRRSHRLLEKSDTIAYARMLIAKAHSVGLAVAHKNTTELLGRGPAMGFDFAMVEDCARWNECKVYADTYDNRALYVEYTRKWFRATCSRVGDRAAVVLRDRYVSEDGPFRTC